MPRKMIPPPQGAEVVPKNSRNLFSNLRSQFVPCRYNSMQQRTNKNTGNFVTTTVYDLSAQLLTSDSRWSAKTDDLSAIAFLDEDVGFDKIEHAHGHAFLFAGDSAVIDQWKQFLRGKPGSAQGRPGLAGIALLIVAVAGGNIRFSHGQDIWLPNNGSPHLPASVFAGSGSHWAAVCWNTNRCGKKAIDTAKQWDVFSGGATKFFDLATGENNLSNTASLAEMKRLFIEKGMIMYVNGAQQPLPLKTAAANDHKVKQLCDAIAKGQIAPSAPCDAMFGTPTADDEQRLDEALNSIFQDR